MGDLTVVPLKHLKTIRASRRNEDTMTTVDGITLATSTKCKHGSVTQEMKHEQATGSTPVPPNFNVGMCLKESVLRSLRVSSELTLRPIYATQH